MAVRKLITISIPIIGLVGTYVTVIGYWAPRIAVQPLPITEPRNALDAGFSVTNQGMLAIHDVAIGYAFINFVVREMSPEKGIENLPPGSEPYVKVTRRTGKEPPEPEIGTTTVRIPTNAFYKTIPSLRSATMRPGIELPGEDDLDVDIIVYFRPSWYPFGRREIFRFVTRTARNGELQWVPRPD